MSLGVGVNVESITVDHKTSEYSPFLTQGTYHFFPPGGDMSNIFLDIPAITILVYTLK